MRNFSELFGRSPAAEAAKRLAQLRSEYTQEEIVEARITNITERLIKRFSGIDDDMLIWERRIWKKRMGQGLLRC